MAKRNKLLEKLVRASGGWENFLYETLKEVCDVYGHSASTSFTVEVVEGAVEILEAYEETIKEHVQYKQVGEQIKQELNAKPVEKVYHGTTIPKKVDKPKPEIVEPRKITAKVGVDTDAGWSQGYLPLPEGYRVINKDRLTITTRNGIELGRGGNDGQVRGQDVSGHIGNDGKYRLVFKEATLGVGLINFEILPIPSISPAPTRPENYVPVDPKFREVALREVAKEVPVDPPRNADGSNVKQVG